MLINDASRAYVQDTLIVSMQKKIDILQNERRDVYGNFNSQIAVLNEKYAVQVEQTGIERSLKEHHKREGRKFKRQRNIVIGVTAVIGIYTVFKPP